MSRPRKRDKQLPPYVRIRSGSYYYRDRKICRVRDGEAALYDALAKLKAAPSIDRIPAAVAAFKLDHLPALSTSARKEHDRLLSVFANEFAEFAVDQVKATHIRKSAYNLYGKAGHHAAARHYKARISTFFRWTVEIAGLRDDNPAREVWLEKPPAKRTPWTPALFWQARELLSPIMQCYHDLTYLLYQRTTDVRLLMASQISGGMIRVRPSKTSRKSGAEIDIPITPAIQAVLERAAALAKVKAGPGGDAPVIQTPNGSPYTRSGVYSAYRNVDKAIVGKDEDGRQRPLLGLNPKALRPFAGLEAERRGFTREQIRVGYAHTSIRTTEGYLRKHEIPVSPVLMDLPERQKT